ncbi:hypothetical protein MA9V1_188 [Chryseobacterium phage MA9V-1]|nr:hypothetical protein MA9V1_188 [Chryseobacterium phage MA9V-1]
MDKIITFEYAAANLAAFQLQPIPNTKKGMTKDEVNAYISVDQVPLASYVGNRLVPISKVIGVTKVPADLTYYIMGSMYNEQGNYNESYVWNNGYSEYRNFSTLANDDMVVNVVAYFQKVYRRSNSDPSFNAEFALNFREPLNAILEDVFNLAGFALNANNIEMSRTMLQMIGWPAADYGDQIYKENGTDITKSTTYQKMFTSSPPLVNPSTNLGIMTYGESDLPNTNAHNKVRDRELLKINVGPSGQNEILPQMTRDTLNTNTNGYWDVQFSLNPFECSYVIKRLTGGDAKFAVKYFAPL